MTIMMKTHSQRLALFSDMTARGAVNVPIQFVVMNISVLPAERTMTVCLYLHLAGIKVSSNLGIFSNVTLFSAACGLVRGLAHAPS